MKSPLGTNSTRFGLNTTALATHRTKLMVAIAIFVALHGGASRCQAQPPVHNWVALGLSGNWTDPGNWAFFQVPPNDGTHGVNFDFSFNPFPNVDEPYHVAGISFGILSQNYEMNGDELTIGPVGIEIFNPSVPNHFFENAIKLSASQSWDRGLTLLGGINLNGHHLTTTGNHFAGQIHGSGHVSIFGGATFTNVNTYTGSTVIWGGLNMSGAGRLPSTGDVQFVDPLDGNGIGGTWSLNGIHQTVGALGSTGGPGGDNVINLGGATLTIGNSGFDGFYYGRILGSGNLVKVGNGIQFLRSSQAHDGFTTVQGGALYASTSNIQGNITNNAQYVFDQNFDGSYHGIISGTGTVSKTGSGTVTLTAGNAFDGPLDVSLGRIRLTGNGRISDLTDVSVGPSGTFELDGVTDTVASLGGAGNVIVNSVSNTLTVGVQNGDSTFSGTISGAGNFQKWGTGVQTLSGNNTYSGRTLIGDGTLRLEGAGQLADASSVVFTGPGMFELSGVDVSIDRLIDATASGHVQLDGGTLSVGSIGGTGIYEGTISGTGGLTKVGAGSQTLTGNNDYSGETLISAGKLFAENTVSSATGSGDVTVSSSATLGGTGSISGHVSVDAGGKVAPGSSTAGQGELTVNSATFASDATLDVEIFGPNAASEYDVLNVQAIAALDGSLSVNLGGYAPVFGETFDVVKAESVIGEFDAYDGLSSAAGVFLLPQYASDGVSLTAVLAADGNLDETVTAADYTIWADGFGAGNEFTGGDYSGNGSVGPEDYTLWANNFGLSASAPTEALAEPVAPAFHPPAAAVPEPSTLALLGLGAAMLLCRRIRS